MANRGQSETIGVVLMLAIVVVTMSAIGVAMFAHQAQEIERMNQPASFESTVNASTLTLAHTGGNDHRLTDLELILRTADTEIRYQLDDSSNRVTAVLDTDAYFAGGESITVAHSLSGTIRIMLVDNQDESGGELLYSDEKRISETASIAASPVIETFTITDTSTNGDASFNVTWNGSDPQGDLTEVTVELSKNDTVEDTVTTTFGGVASTGLHTDTVRNSSGGGEVYTITLTMRDAAGHTTSETLVDTADSDIGLRDPVIETFQTTDTSTGSDVSYDYTYNVSDPDADLTQVKLELYKESTGVLLDNVTDAYSGVVATGLQSGTLLDPAGSKSNNEEYRITLTATDLEGNDVVSSTTDIADGDGTGGGGTGVPPVVDTFNVTDTTTTSADKNNKVNASFDVEWRASDSDGNLQNASLELWNKNENQLLDSVSYTSGDFSSGSDTGLLTGSLSEAKGEGKEYVIKLVVTDSTGKSTTESERHVADGDDDGEPL